jgi:hypothetical protein
VSEVSLQRRLRYPRIVDPTVATPPRCRKAGPAASTLASRESLELLVRPDIPKWVRGDLFGAPEAAEKDLGTVAQPSEMSSVPLEVRDLFVAQRTMVNPSKVPRLRVLVVEGLFFVEGRLKLDLQERNQAL